MLTAILRGKPPMTFLSIFNVFDARKQMKPMLEGFIQLSLDYPDAILLLKLTFTDRKTGDPNEALFLHQILEANEIPPILVSDRIWITTDVLSRDDLNALYDLSAFYLSTSHAEGQNLPLLEAMGRGAVPVTVDNTAMKDYITAENAVIIPSFERPITPRLSGRYGLRDISICFVHARDVLVALKAAMELDNDAYASRSAAALATVRNEFGIEIFRAAIERVVRTATEVLGRVGGSGS